MFSGLTVYKCGLTLTGPHLRPQSNFSLNLNNSVQTEADVSLFSSVENTFGSLFKAVCLSPLIRWIPVDHEMDAYKKRNDPLSHAKALASSVEALVFFGLCTVDPSSSVCYLSAGWPHSWLRWPSAPHILWTVLLASRLHLVLRRAEFSRDRGATNEYICLPS